MRDLLSQEDYRLRLESTLYVLFVLTIETPKPANSNNEMLKALKAQLNHLGTILSITGCYDFACVTIIFP